MTKIILLYYITVVLFKSYSCWIINNINSKMVAERLQIADEEVREDNFLKEINFIYPGTKWCGAGTVAEDYDDLGTEREADMCCRDHDNCPDIIAGGDSKYNLTNTAFYTRLNCNCDETFRTCLKLASTRAAKTIGSIYFNALQTKCFRKDYPVLGCLRSGGWLKLKCLEHSYDTKKEQEYQWFDVNDF